MKKFVALAIGIAVLGTASVAASQVYFPKKTPATVDYVKFDSSKYKVVVYNVPKNSPYWYDNVNAVWYTYAYVLADNNPFWGKVTFTNVEWDKYTNFLADHKADLSKYGNISWKVKNDALEWDATHSDMIQYEFSF